MFPFLFHFLEIIFDHRAYFECGFYFFIFFSIYNKFLFFKFWSWDPFLCIPQTCLFNSIYNIFNVGCSRSCKIFVHTNFYRSWDKKRDNFLSLHIIISCKEEVDVVKRRFICLEQLFFERRTLFDETKN